MNLFAGTYTVAFLAASGSSGHDVTVKVDGSTLSEEIAYGGQFREEVSVTFTVTGGEHTLTLSNTSGVTEYLDDVNISTPVSGAISDPSFEGLSLGAVTYTSRRVPIGLSTRTRRAHSDGTFNMPSGEDGTQAAFMQSGAPSDGNLTQMVSLAAGTYELSYLLAEQSSGSGQGVKISVGGTSVESFSSLPAGNFHAIRSRIYHWQQRPPICHHLQPHPRFGQRSTAVFLSMMCSSSAPSAVIWVR